MVKRGRPFVRDLIKLKEVPALIAELIGVSRRKAAVYSWATKGITNNHGKKVKLKTYKRLNVLYTTKEDVKEFLLKMGE